MSTLFCGFELDYELMDLDDLLRKDSCCLINLNATSKLMLRIFIKLRLLNKLSSTFVLYLSGIDVSRFKQVIIKDNLLYLFLFSVLDIDKKIIFRNIATEIKIKLVKSAKCYSFDPKDCEKYSFYYYPQYTSGFSYILNNEFSSEFECSFIGINKGRGKLIRDVCGCFPDRKHNILLIEPQGSWLDKLKIRKNHNLSYLDYLHFQLSGKYVLDIVQKGQSGDSMRFIEAMVAGKKVITNNKNIINHPLYSPNNVLYFQCPQDLSEKITVFKEQLFDSSSISNINHYRPESVIRGIMEDS
ncbi:TPA: hypothetical protein ACMDW2_001510 [Vibrio parahaemolyticus]